MKRMKKFWALLLALAMTCSLAACGGSSDEEPATDDQTTEDTAANDAGTESDLAYVQDKGTLVVGITEFAPMDYKDDNGQWTGFDAELARLVAQRLGVDVEFVIIEWGQKVNELNSKAIDVVWNGMTLTDGVQTAMTCTPAYCCNAQVIVVPAA